MPGCVPPGRPALTEEAIRAWVEGLRVLKGRLPQLGRSYDGELELLARYLQDDAGRPEQSWDDDSPGWRYGFSWETAASEFALEMSENAPAYRAAMESPEGLRVLAQLDDERDSSPNPAAGRLGVRLRSVAVSRREALMRLGLLEHALAVEAGIPSNAPTHPLGHPVTMAATEQLIRVGSEGSNGHWGGFELMR